MVSFTDDPNIPDQNGSTPIHSAAKNGHIDVLKVLAPLTKNPNRGTVHGKFLGETPIQTAQRTGHHEFSRMLQSYINTGHF